jgi:DNA-binding SARP family transcriptional activator/class 3 adenylate cyclase/tetratricopeptide (TPR) repeat protein
LEFRILGPLEVLDEDRRVTLPRGRGRSLLALLALRPGEVASKERLIDELWGEASPPTADKALQGLVSHLRKRLEPTRARGNAPSVLQTVPLGYVLAIDPDSVDAVRFRRLLQKAGLASPSERSALLRRALGLWRGPALADFAYEPFAQREIAGLEDLRLTAIEERVEADLAVGRHHELVAELEELVAEHPFRERLRGQLMLALYRAGRQADALDVFRSARRTLVDELGIEPGPALQQLEHAILRQDRLLDLEPTPGSLLTAAERVDLPADSPSVPWLSGERRTVTVLFADLAVSQSAGAELDPEARRRVLVRSRDAVARVLGRHGARVEEFVGEVVAGLFGIPTAHEDDALRAVRAALELRVALIALNEEFERVMGIRLRTQAGIETGEVAVGPSWSGHEMASGDAVRTAARLQRAAGDGEVLVGEGTRRLLEGAALMEPVQSPDPDGPILAWKVLDVLPGTSGVASQLDAPMVGRGADLARLHAALERAVGQAFAYRFTVLGDPGIGKSRLAREFTETLGDAARVLTGHCPAYGEGITFWPLREIALNAAAGDGAEALVELLRGEEDGQRIAAQVAGSIGLTPEPGRADELFPAVRRLFEALAREDPLVVVLEDLHWAEPTFLDLIDYLTSGTRGPIFLLCLARPELLEERPAWGAGGRSTDTLVLEPLGRAEIQELIADRPGGGRLSLEAVAHIAGIAQGNPLFAEQLVAAFEHEGTVIVPASLQALLAARLDRLGPGERDLLRCAAVAGTDFSVAAISLLVPENARRFVDRHLAALERKQFVRPARSGAGFSFRHVLVRLAAYGSMTREDRARLHERFAEWLEGDGRRTLPELDEVLGYHLEQAVEHRRMLRGADDHDRQLAARAGEHLARAGLRAHARLDAAAAVNLSSRAKSLLPSGHPRRREVMRVLAEAYPMQGSHDASDAVLVEMLDEARAEGDHLLEEVVRLERARLRLLTGPDPTRLETIKEGARRALALFSESGDHARAAQACYVLGSAHMREGATRESEAVSRAGLAHADRSGRPREEVGPRWSLALAIRAGETPVTEAARMCEELLHRAGRLHPGVLCELATLRAMEGKFDGARKMIAQARRVMVERMRMRRPLMWAARSSAMVETLARDLASAERELRAALDLAVAFHERDPASKIAAHLSRVLARQTRWEEAERFAILSEQHAPAESAAAQALWRSAKARGMVRGGDRPQAAERLAREAVRLVPTEMPNLRGDLLVDLAEVLRAGGDLESARQAISQAIELYERKGNVVSAARARSLAG